MSSVPLPRPAGNRRVTGAEQFYTPFGVAAQVTAGIIAAVPRALERVWFEPAGGTGVFVDAALTAGARQVLSIDTDPRHPSVSHGDFLTGPPPPAGAIVFGNPPFGRNNSLSVRFFNRAAQTADDIAFIVPRSWRKWSVQNRLDRSFVLVSDTDLIVDYTTATGIPVNSAGGTLQTCVQHWTRASEPRALQTIQDFGVISRTTPALADATLTIFGWSCGTVLTDFLRTPNTTRMFLSLHHPRALEALRAVDYTRFSKNVAYTPALSLPEINYLLNEYLFDDTQPGSPVDAGRIPRIG